MTNQKITDLTALTSGQVDRTLDQLEIADVSASQSKKITPNALFGITTGSLVSTTDTQTLTGKTLTAPTISSPVISGTITGTYTIGGTPTFPATVVLTTGSQTLTGKTLTSPTINTPTIVNATISANAVTGFTTANTGTIYGVPITLGVISTASTVNGSAVVAASIPTAAYGIDSVTDNILDFPRWWQEIGRTTLTLAGDTISLTGLPLRKYLMIKVAVSATGGTISVGIRFNNDTAANYSDRSSTNGAADATDVSQSNIILTGASAYTALYFNGEMLNLAAAEKNVVGFRIGNFSAAGAGTAPDRAELTGKWANTAAQVSRVDILNLSGTGDFAIGSEVVVLGHD